MTRIIKNLTIIIIFIFIYFNRDIVADATVSAFNLWLKCLFPNIFPILILSDALVCSSIIGFISNTIGKYFSKLFKLSKYSAYVFIMSTFSGMPSNAKYIKDLLDNNIIEKNEAEKLLSMSMLYNPLLILSITGFLNKKDSIFILLCNFFINIFIGLINRNYPVNIKNTITKHKEFNLVNSINNSINTLLSILGIITLFSIINSIIPFKSPMISGLMEITTGINLLNYSTYSYNSKMLVVGILFSFGGLSIITQIKSIFKNDTLNYTIFYKSRIYHVLIMIILIKMKSYLN